MDPHSPNKLFATKYCFLILGDDTNFYFLIISLVFRGFFVFCFLFLLFYVILLLFYKNYSIIIILFNYFFFHENYFYFFMFRDVPGCSVFRVLSTPVEIEVSLYVTLTFKIYVS